MESNGVSQVYGRIELLWLAIDFSDLISFRSRSAGQ